MKKVLIIGGASAIANETAKYFAAEGASLYLTDLRLSRLEAVRDDILARGKTDIFIEELDATELARHSELIERAERTLGGLDAVLIAHGTLPVQHELEENTELIARELNVNFVSAAHFALVAAKYFEENGGGTVAVISSVAGDRGRQSNFVYGSAKGGLTLFLQGLRNRFDSKGVKIITIKPGMVDTPMTADMPKSPLFASAKDVGKGIYNAMKKGKDVAYLPGWWRLIMWVIVHIPETIFKKLKL